MISTGIRVGAIKSLKIKHLKKLKEEIEGCTQGRTIRIISCRQNP